MIQFLGRWLDPKHVLTISRPYFYECMIEVQIQFMFMNSPVIFYKSVKKECDDDTVNRMKEADEYAESEEYKGLIKAVEIAKSIRISPEMPELF